jgi:signal peptidase I
MGWLRKTFAATSILSLIGVLGLPLIPHGGGLVNSPGASAATFTISTQSMEPTLKPGEQVSATAVNKGTQIKLGDVLIIKAPKSLAGSCGVSVTDVIDRVIGLPGDRLSSKGNTILINGKPLKETWTHTEPLGNPIGNITVPQTHYFVMGDNQADSCDSRSWGTVSRSHIIAIVVLPK